MDAPPKPLLVFADRVIGELIEHLVGEEISTANADYLTIRTAFRKAGGKWERVSRGDIVHTRLLANIVTAWGSMPERKVAPLR